VFNTTDSDRMIDIAAKGIHEGWLSSVYRLGENERIRTDERARELYDQDA
jgi:hypothetical protein